MPMILWSVEKIYLRQKLSSCCELLTIGLPIANYKNILVYLYVNQPDMVGRKVLKFIEMNKYPQMKIYFNLNMYLLYLK